MWNLDSIHKIGELVAAIAVVISLLFVGFEVQQNNRIQKQVATRSLVRDWSDAYIAYQDPGLACLWVRLMTDNESLTLQESTQIEAVYLRIYKAHEEMHYQYQEGVIDESVWGGFAYTIAAEAAYQGFRDMWQGYRNTFSARFQKYMEELIAATPVDPDAYFMEKTCDTPVGKDYWRPY
jgi:hypothetical protein